MLKLTNKNFTYPSISKFVGVSGVHLICFKCDIVVSQLKPA